MPKTEDLKLESASTSRSLFVGPSGSGKTTAAASYPKPLYIFDFDSNLTCLAGMQGIEYDTFKTVEDFNRKVKELAAKPEAFKSYMFDSTTTLSMLVLQYFAKINGHLDSDGKMKFLEKGGVSQQDYGQRVGWFSEFLYRLQAWPAHIIVISHEETVKDELLGNIKTRAALPGRDLPDTAPGFFNEVYKFESISGSDPSKRETRVHTVADTRFAAKTGYRGKLPPYITLKMQPSGYVEGLWDKIQLALKGG